MPVTVQELAPEIKELRCRTGVVSVSGARVGGPGAARRGCCRAATALVCDVLLLLFRAGMGVLCSFMGAIPLSHCMESAAESGAEHTLFFASVEENWLHLPTPPSGELCC